MDFPPNYGRILGGFELEIGRRSVLLTPGPGNGREGRLAVHDTARGRVPIPDSRLPPAAGGIPVPPPQGPAAAKCIPVPARQTVPSRGQLPYRYGGGFGIGTAGMSLCGISAGSPTRNPTMARLPRGQPNCRRKKGKGHMWHTRFNMATTRTPITTARHPCAPRTRATP